MGEGRKEGVMVRFVGACFFVVCWWLVWWVVFFLLFVCLHLSVFWSFAYTRKKQTKDAVHGLDIEAGVCWCGKGDWCFLFCFYWLYLCFLIYSQFIPSFIQRTILSTTLLLLLLLLQTPA